MKANAIKNYRAAWNLFRKVHRAGVPVFHKKRTEQKYQTSNHYAANKGTPTMVNGSVRLLDKKHLHLPKLGKIRFKGLPQKIFSHRSTIRIGTTTIAMDATGRYYVSLQLAVGVDLCRNITHWYRLKLNTGNLLTDSILTWLLIRRLPFSQRVEW